MTIDEALAIVDKDGGWTDENLETLDKVMKESDFSGFTDPELKKFMDYIYKAPYHEKIQEMITDLVVSFMEKGIASPCGGNCGACTFHDLEFGA